MEAAIRAKIRERVRARLAAGYPRDWSDPNPDWTALYAGSSGGII